MDKGIVFIYHRVTDLARDPQLLAVHPQRFDEQIEYLKNRFTIIPLQELVNRLTTGKSISNFIVITFDDGYTDILYEAKPILEKHRVPATVFVTAGMIASRREFWWDELERIFLVEGKIIDKDFELNIKQNRYVFSAACENDAKNSYKRLQPLLKSLSHSQREKIIDSLFKWAGLDREQGRGTHRVLTKNELRELVKGDLVEIGAHTMTHTQLNVESAAVQQLEISQSKRVLEDILGIETRSFSYPFGTLKDFDETSVQIVKSCNYNCGVANVQNNVDQDADLFKIPRRLVRNWNFLDFRKIIDKYALDYPEINKSKLYSRELKKKIDTYLEHLNHDFVRTNREQKQEQKREYNVKNVLMINTHDNLGGAAKVALTIADGLAKEKYRTYLLVKYKLSKEQRVREIYDDFTYEQVFLKKIQSSEGWLDFFHSSSFNIKNHPFFKNSDIIHLHNLHGNYFTSLALPGISRLKPTFWTLHDMQAITGHCAHSFDCDKWETGCDGCPYPGIYPKINKDHADFNWKIKKIIFEESNLTIVCPSKWLKSKVENSILQKSNVNLIYNGVDERVFVNADKQRARQLLSLPRDKLILLFAAIRGLKNFWKGGDYLLQVYNALNSRDILFLTIGDTELNKKNWISKEEISDQEELALYYSCADLLVYPSIADNCPFIVLEAMACGTPVVAFKTGGIPELVTHKKNGYLAEYKEVTDLIKGIKYFSNPADRKKAGFLARERVLKHFTAELMTKKYRELYEEVFMSFFRQREIGGDRLYKKIIETVDDYLPAIYDDRLNVKNDRSEKKA